PDRRSLRVSRGQGSGVRMARASAPAARRRPGLHAVRSVPRKPSRGFALGSVLAQDGTGRRPTKMSAPDGKGERMNFLAELKRRNVYKVAMPVAQLLVSNKKGGVELER